ncbi:pilus assembly protein TadG-related protein [Devosia sp.]|uniref:TadE/TadG family type IV pilus assembly protein n=1 Tax=Devosia sp. TaxID=1871048 RepID=UPI003BABB530
MRNLYRLVQRFRSDERGVFAIMFALLAIVLIATAGAVVDFTAIEQARTRAQQALDSAALGLQPTIFTTGVTATTIKPKALQLLTERLNDAAITASVDTVNINLTDGTLKLTASIVVPTAFVALVGFPTIRAKVVSEATRKRLNLEVAMVLDNSGSMASYSRMTNLKIAARCAMDVLYNNITDCATATLTATDPLAATNTNVKIGIVPFTGFVNVGPGNKTAGWMDQTGLNSFANDNFDSDDNDATTYTGTVNRFTLYNNIGVTWQGCVEARKYPYDTNDTAPSTATPDTLFIPEFAPDEPDSGYTNSYLTDRPAACTNKDQGSWVKTIAKTTCTLNGNGNATNFNNATCTGTTTTTTVQKDKDGANVTPAAATEPATVNGQPKNCTDSYIGSKISGSNPSRYNNTYTRTCSYTFSDRELQERLCKYTGTASSSAGPNEDCPTNPLTPLTATKATVRTAINAMSSQSYTNVHQGAIWGFHMLSPGEPLTEGLAYDAATAKVMIIMTDGENTVNGYNSSNMNKANGYMPYGYPGSPSWGYNGRIYSTTYPEPSSDAEVTAAMDTRAVEACANAKLAGITIYTIGLSPPNTKTEDMLTDCATDSSKAFFPTTSAELVTVFKTIADQLSNLRLSQ